MLCCCGCPTSPTLRQKTCSWRFPGRASRSATRPASVEIFSGACRCSTWSGRRRPGCRARWSSGRAEEAKGQPTRTERGPQAKRRLSAHARRPEARPVGRTHWRCRRERRHPKRGRCCPRPRLGPHPQRRSGPRCRPWRCRRAAWSEVMGPPWVIPRRPNARRRRSRRHRRRAHGSGALAGCKSCQGETLAPCTFLLHPYLVGARVGWVL